MVSKINYKNYWIERRDGVPTPHILVAMFVVNQYMVIGITYIFPVVQL